MTSCGELWVVTWSCRWRLQGTGQSGCWFLGMSTGHPDSFINSSLQIVHIHLIITYHYVQYTFNPRTLHPNSRV